MRARLAGLALISAFCVGPVSAQDQSLGLNGQVSADGIVVIPIDPLPLDTGAETSRPQTFGEGSLPLGSGTVIAPAPVMGEVAPVIVQQEENGDVTLTDNGDAGQSGVLLETSPAEPDLGGVTSITEIATETGSGALLRALDKTLAQSRDLELATGAAARLGRITVEMVECRYPEGDANSDAFAHMRITDTDGRALFDGWMVASSPALIAFDHPRYDVWVLRCSTS